MWTKDHRNINRPLFQYTESHHPTHPGGGGEDPEQAQSRGEEEQETPCSAAPANHPPTSHGACTDNLPLQQAARDWGNSLHATHAGRKKLHQGLGGAAERIGKYLNAGNKLFNSTLHSKISVLSSLAHDAHVNPLPWILKQGGLDSRDVQYYTEC